MERVKVAAVQAAPVLADRDATIGVTACVRATGLTDDLPGRADLYGGPEEWLSRGNSAIVGPDGGLLAGLPGRGNVRVHDGSWAEWAACPIPRWPPPDARGGAAITLRSGGNDMAGLIRKSLDSPEEVRKFEADSGHLELVNLDAGPVGRATFQPGWRWSLHVKPIAKTESCQAAHTGYFVSGRMKVVMDDGQEMEYGPGDFAIMAPGHDAWIVGDEPCVVIDWQGFADYAKP